MKVYYTVPEKDFEEHSKIYQFTRQVLINNKCTLTTDWIPNYLKKKTKTTDYNAAQYYQESIKNINDADITIFDTTVSSMSVGHQLTYALFRQKPSLLLIDASKRGLNNLFIAGSASPLLEIKDYGNTDDLKRIVEEFIEKNSDAKKFRLNLALDKKPNDYLIWASYNYKKSKTEVVNLAIEKLMNSDSEYQNSLNS